MAFENDLFESSFHSESVVSLPCPVVHNREWIKSCVGMRQTCNKRGKMALFIEIHVYLYGKGSLISVRTLQILSTLNVHFYHKLHVVSQAEEY